MWLNVTLEERVVGNNIRHKTRVPIIILVEVALCRRKMIKYHFPRGFSEERTSATRREFQYNPCRSGGIGRRARFRFVWFMPWGFDPLLRHQKKISDQSRNLFLQSEVSHINFSCWSKFKVQSINRHTFAVRLEFQILANAQADPLLRHQKKISDQSRNLFCNQRTLV